MGQTLKWWPTQLTDERPRWREQKNIYNQRDLTKGGFGRHQEVLLVEYQKRRRRIHPRTKPEDGLWPSPQLHRWRFCSPRILLDRWWSPHKGPVLKPASLPNSLYWARWVWVRSHLQWKTPSPKTGPYSYYYYYYHHFIYKYNHLIDQGDFWPKIH